MATEVSTRAVLPEQMEVGGGTAVQPIEDANNVSSLVRLAIERGVDVEVLERLVALQERVTERDARAAFFGALASFQEQVPEISKSRKAKIATRNGGEYEYTYAPLEEITRTIRPALKENGLSYSWDVAAGDGSLIVACVLRHIDGHQERATFPVPVDTSAKMSDAQKNGAALTYGRRQSLIAVLGLTTADADPDGADPKGPELISESQAADLQVLLDECGKKIDREKFMRWLGSLGAESLEKIRKADYPRVVDLLQKKRGES
jgi:hypothetical protein